MAAAGVLIGGCAGMGAAQQIVSLPVFDGGTVFQTVPDPQSIAATPDGLDLVGASGWAPDGFADIAVASRSYGLVQFYRNVSQFWGTQNQQSALQPIFAQPLDIFSIYGFPADTNSYLIRDIKLVDMDNDDTPDLVVAIEHLDEDGVSIGKIASFKAVRDPSDSSVSFVLLNDVDLDFPVSHLAVADFTQDGFTDIVASTFPFQQSGTPTGINKIYRIQNVFQNGTYGYLAQSADLTVANTSATEPTYNVVAGQFSTFQTFGSGNKVDIVSFGTGSNDTIHFGIGTATGPFSLSTNLASGTDCDPNPGSSSTTGLSTGKNQGPDESDSLLAFNPFSTSTKQTLAATSGAGVIRLLHNKPRSGSFFNLCFNDLSTDEYVVPMGFPPPNQFANYGGYIASGRLNGDTYDDLVYVDSRNVFLAFLLGQGIPDAENKILKFDDNPMAGHYIQNYAPFDSDTFSFDRAICVDMNNDMRDEIFVTRMDDWTGTGQWFFVAYFNQSR